MRDVRDRLCVDPVPELFLQLSAGCFMRGEPLIVFQIVSESEHDERLFLGKDSAEEGRTTLLIFQMQIRLIILA